MQNLITSEEVIGHGVAVLNGENPRKVFPRFKSALEKNKESKSKKAV